MISLRFISVGIVLASLMVSSPGVADDCDNPSADSSQIDGKYVEDLVSALADFRRTRQSLECFKIELDVEGLDTHIAFIPKHTDQEGINLGGRTPCGLGVSYLLRSGKIKKKWFAR